LITIASLRSLANTRLSESDTLVYNGHYDGAVYLCGYAIELALKGKICDTLKWKEFPFNPNEFRDYQSFRTHDLDVLLHLSGIEAAIKSDHLEDWSQVADWNPDLRYRTGAHRESVQSMINSARSLLSIMS
jgi:hypothetical protein